MKRAVRITLIVLIILAAGLFGARLLLSSHFMANKVASQLADIYGGKVEVAVVHIGLVNESTLGGLRLFEAGSMPEPWLTARSVEADLSALGFLTGDTMPDRITVSGANVSLRFGKAGHLLTQLPHGKGHPPKKGKSSVYPDIRVQNSRIILHQEDRPNLVLEGIDADLVDEGTQLVIRGTIADPIWGRWKVLARFGRPGNDLTVTLQTTSQVHVTLAMLRELPFVPPSVWQTVQVADDTSAAVTVHYDPATSATSYRVVLNSTQAHVEIPSIGLEARGAHGQTVIEDGIVRLRNVEGAAYGGTIQTSADLDFRGPQTRLKFSPLKVRRLLVDKLRQHWTFPVSGRLTGQADMEFILAGGKVETRGQGKGVITENELGAPVEIELHGGPGGFRLSNPQGKPLSKKVSHGGAIPSLPALLVNRSHAGLVNMVQGLVDFGGGLVNRFSSPAARRPSQPAASATKYLDASLKMEDVNLAHFIEGIGFHVPFPVSGQFSFEVTLGIPTNAPGNLQAYRAAGTATADHLELAGIRLQQVRARIAYRGGVLHLEELRARIPVDGLATPARPPSLIRGTAQMGLVPMSDLTADITLQNIPLATLAQVLPAVRARIQGAVAGSFRARVPVARIGSLNAWDMSGKLAASTVRVLGWTATAVATDLQLQKGTLSLANTRLRALGVPVTGLGRLHLSAPYDYQAAMVLKQTDLAKVQGLAPKLKLPVPIEGTLQTTLTAQGTLQPPVVRVSGTSAATAIQVAGVRFQSVKLRWQADANRLTLSAIEAKLYQGTLSGSAVVPINASATGNLALRLEGVDVAGLAKDIPRNPVRLAGKASGTIKGTISRPDGRADRITSLQVDMTAPQLRIQGIPARRVQGNVKYQAGKFDYRIDGQTLGGKFHLSGQLPPAASPTVRPSREGRRPLHPVSTRLVQARPAAAEGRLQLEGVRLSQLWEALGVQTGLGPLRGRADLDVTFGHEGPNRAPVGTGRFVLSGLRWHDADLAGRLTSDVILDPQQLRLTNLSGSVGAGRLSGRVGLNLKSVDRSWIDIRLSGIEAARLLAPWPALATVLQGRFDAHLHSTVGREWLGSGRIWMARGKLGGLEIADWHLPIDWTLAPNYGRGEVHVRETSLQLAHGRANARATYIYGASNRLEGQINFLGVDLRSLLREIGETSSLGSGRLTGRFDFASSDFHGLGDLSGSLEATLSQAQTAEMPVLRQLTPYLRMGFTAASTFSSGSLRATVARGVIRIQRWTLIANLFQLLIGGTVTADGRLDLDVVGIPGGTGTNPNATGILQRIPVAGPISVGLLTEITGLLGSRLIHLRVTGTMRNPIVRYQPRLLGIPSALR